MSSVGSTTSTIVSFRGNEDMELEDALDELYRDIQHNLNHSQCVVRQLAACPEQDCDFLEAVTIQFQLEDYVDILLELFSELKDISKQTLGKPPVEHKEEYKKMVNDRKEKLKKEKDEQKELVKQMKVLEKLKVIHE